MEKNSCIQILVEGSLIKNGGKTDFINQLNKVDKRHNFCLESFEETPSEEQVESSDIIICKTPTYFEVMLKRFSSYISSDNCETQVFTISLGKDFYKRAEAIIGENSLWTSSYDLAPLYFYDRIFVEGYLENREKQKSKRV